MHHAFDEISPALRSINSLNCNVYGTLFGATQAKTVDFASFVEENEAIVKSIEQVRAQVPLDFIKDEDWHRALPDLTLAARYSALSRALKKQEILKLRRGLYVFAPRWRKHPLLSSFTLANHILQPSCVSLESALSHHGLIPEAVYTLTSAHPTRKSKEFHTPIGLFSYQYVPCYPFYAWVERVQQHEQSYALIAHPYRALLDWAYVKRKSIASLNDLEGDIRLDIGGLRESLSEHAAGEMLALADSYKKKKISKLNFLIMKEFK